MGLDRLSLGLVIPFVLACAACGHGGRPKLLLHGEPAAEFRPVPGSVISITRALRGSCVAGASLRSRARKAKEGRSHDKRRGSATSRTKGGALQRK